VIRALSRRGRIAAALLAPAFLFGTPALAVADTSPEEASRFEETRRTAGRDGATTERILSCSDGDGNVYQERTVTTAGENGNSTRTIRSGDPAACDPTADQSTQNEVADEPTADEAAGDAPEQTSGEDAAVESGERAAPTMTMSVGDVSVFGNGVAVAEGGGSVPGVPAHRR
jgi:hypothetical protein